ncbi:unnamed protein product [Pleuronectes platessa]|uniref:Uncharacterized protein n=1 Tax=Pleuronectes platessa TaxID=8262 RepID=A0A9N7UMU8_PLEPL|nr:unnamed protein product [Pleuronectes platessa]
MEQHTDGGTRWSHSSVSAKLHVPLCEVDQTLLGTFPKSQTPNRESNCRSAAHHIIRPDSSYSVLCSLETQVQKEKPASPQTKKPIPFPVGRFPVTTVFLPGEIRRLEPEESADIQNNVVKPSASCELPPVTLNVLFHLPPEPRPANSLTAL